MGVVYRARDTKLNRTVALKFLPAVLTRDPEAKERFIREAQAASALEHPNICTVFEIEETPEGQSFIAMSFCEGETLKKKIEQHPLDVNLAMDIAIQCCQALHKAHEKGIVHRDIKPANIMITADHQVKIVDFGLAKLSGKTQLSREGSTLGTVAYMSPEQAQGEMVDHRTDIWSIGVVLYEMICGQLPFKGEYEQAIIHSIINENPHPLTGLRTSVPVELEKIVNKCMEKDPADRYQHMDDIIVDLRHLKADSDSKRISQAHSRPGITPKTFYKKWLWPGILLIGLLTVILVYFLGVQEVESKERIPVAVADFINETNEPEMDGLSGMLITALEQSHRLKVLTRSHMFDVLKQLGKENIDRIDERTGREICRQADINMLALATIRKFGKIYTIDFKLLEITNNQYLFTTTEKGEGKESIPSLIDHLSEKTREGLKEKLAEIQVNSPNIAQVTTPNLEAYQHYFKGEELINKLKFREAREEFLKAIALDSTFGLAYYRLAYAIDWERDTQTARKYIQKAMNLLERIPDKEKYLVRAEYANIEEGFSYGLAILREMEKLYPDNKEMIYNIGDWSWHVEDYATAERYLESILSTDPDFERALQHITWTYQDTRQYEKMLQSAKRYVAVSGSEEAYQLLVSAVTRSRDFDSACQWLQQEEKLKPDNYRVKTAISDIYVFQEKYHQAEVYLLPLIEKDKPGPAGSAVYSNLARVYAYQGRYRETCQMLDEVINIHWHTGDTAQAAYTRISKALNLILINQVKASWIEVEETLPFQKLLQGQIYWNALALYYVYYRDYDKGAAIARSDSNRRWYRIILTVIHADKNECSEAEMSADTLMPIIPDPFQILITYHLAKCQFGNGRLEKAEKNLLLLQDITDNTYGFRSWYYPRSFYLLARIYQEKEQWDISKKYYQKFLDLWNDADENLPELIDAKDRMSLLTKQSQE